MKNYYKLVERELNLIKQFPQSFFRGFRVGGLYMLAIFVYTVIVAKFLMLFLPLKVFYGILFLLLFFGGTIWFLHFILYHILLLVEK